MSQTATEWPVAQPLTPLEQRVQVLELAVAALQETQALEERAVERVNQQSQVKIATPSEQMMSAEARTAPPPPPSVAETAFRSMSPSVGSKLADLPWLLLEIYREAIAIFRMFIDLNYKVAWSTRLLTVVLLPMILLSWWWLPLAHVPMIGGVLEKLVDLVLAFVMFKALSREAHRYLETRNHP